MCFVTKCLKNLPILLPKEHSIKFSYSGAGT